MISFDLRCSHDHVFEVWFRSSADYDSQLEHGLICCPVCGDTAVAKAVMAPNVGAKGNRVAASVTRMPVAAGTQSLSTLPFAAPADLAPELASAIARVAQLQAESLPKSRWVGRRFAAEARALQNAQRAGGDSNDVIDQPIHGQATPSEAQALMDDGIAIMPLLVPFVPPEAQN